MAQSKIISDLLLNVAASTASLSTGIQQAKNELQSFKSGLGSIAKSLAGAFSVAAAVQFTRQSARMAAELEGVQKAFNRLGNSTALLKELKEATNGTVSEFELMKNAVQAANFGISMRELPKLLEFASKRAASTGENIDYLVQSMVTGLGRKSVPILDNLGISAVALNEEIAKTGDFMTAVGNIVDTELVKMGDFVENNISATDRLAASWDNFQRYIGKAVNQTGILDKAMNDLSGTLDVMSTEHLSFWEKMKLSASVYFGNTSGMAKYTGKIIQGEEQKVQEEESKTNDIRQQATELLEVFGNDLVRINGFLEGNNLKAEIMSEIMSRINKAQEESAKKLINVVNLQEKVKDLESQRNLATGDRLKALNREIESTKELIASLQKVGTMGERLDIAKRMGSNNNTEQFRMTDTNPIGTTVSVASGKDLISGSLDKANESYQKLINSGTQFMTLQQKVGYAIQENLGVIGANAIGQLGTAFGNLFTEQEAGFKNVVLGMIEGIRQIIQAQLAAAMAGMIRNEVSTKGIVGLAIAGVGLGVLKAMFASLPSFQRGGHHKGGFRVVGEKGIELESTGPSRIFNHRQTKNILSGVGAGGNDMQLSTVVRGEDLYFVLQQVDRKRGIKR